MRFAVGRRRICIYLRGRNIMDQSYIRFKDDLRKDPIVFERFRDLAGAGKTEELLKELEKEIRRINASLRD